MKRRDFNKIFGSLGLCSLPLLLNKCSVSSYNDAKLSLPDFDDRAVVLIQLKGGNDGLNTLIPLNQYDQYALLRPTIRIQEKDVIPLDTSLDSNKSLGLHPSMNSLKSLYDEGLVTVVQSVGYPSIDRSHFKSTDHWLTGGDGTPENNNIKSGWMGRFLNVSNPDRLIQTPQFLDPLGIQLGNPNTSLGFHIDTDHSCSVNIAGQDPSGYFTAISGAGGLPPSSFPPSGYGEAMEFIVNLQTSTNQYAKRISSVFDKGSNEKPYPDTHLANQLKTVARLLKGGSKTKFFLVQLDDFDTHKDQVVLEDSNHGEHAELLKELSDAVQAFLIDLKALGLNDKILTMTFSEFGRKAAENGDLGTDHGTSAPMFIFGSGKPGVYGDNDKLNALDENSLLTETNYDYRQIYTQVLSKWLGATESQLNSMNFLNFLKEAPDII